MLMVGTLRCRVGGHTAEANYNDFATRQHSTLGANAYVLKAHYLRENGIQAGRNAYDQSVTLLANKHAARLDDPSFCATVAAYARMAATASSEDLLVLAQSVVEAPVSGPCRTRDAYAEAAALPPAPAYAPPQSYAPPVSYEIAAMPATYEPEPPRMEPAPMSEMAPPAAVEAATPLEKATVRLASTEIANAPVIPPVEAAPVGVVAAAATPEQALEAAITALQAATAALKARPAPTH